jgi:hypothetical protein
MLHPLPEKDAELTGEDVMAAFARFPKTNPVDKS